MQAIDAPESAASAALEAGPVPRPCRLRFTGTGREYFGIWIVNLLLTIATLGVYSAWAKVRKMQYFYRNTHLDGSVFDYHGDALAILKGRILAVMLLVLYKLAMTQLGVFALAAMLGLIAVLPWLLTQSYRFRLHNSSYRGLRFGFAGSVSRAYLIFGLPMLVALAPGALAASSALGSPQHPDQKLFVGVTAVLVLAYLALMLVWPYLHFSFKRWQHGDALFGTARASFQAHAGSFYGAYLLAVAMLIGGGAAIAALALLGTGIGAVGHGRIGRGAAAIAGLGALVAFYSAMIGVIPFVAARIQNAVWSGTRVEGVRFEGDVRARRLIGITLTNLLMIVLSLGLLIPFATMRLMKYKIESIRVLDADALQRFEAEAGASPVGATGEGTVDLLDVDFGL